MAATVSGVTPARANSSNMHSIEKTLRWAPSERSAETRSGMSFRK